MSTPRAADRSKHADFKRSLKYTQSIVSPQVSRMQRKRRFLKAAKEPPRLDKPPAALIIGSLERDEDANIYRDLATPPTTHELTFHAR